MIPVLDELNVDVACVGNHDYDFGIQHLEELIKKTKTSFPWLLSNLFNSKNEKPLPPGVEFYILDHDGIRFGFMGLIEYDWVLTQNTIKPSDYIYQDFIIKAKSLVQFFKSQNCDIIIALTHMRNYNDIALAEEVPEIDLILGGHDHDFFHKAVNGNLIIKSGTDFRQLTFNTFKIYKNDSPPMINNSNNLKKSENDYVVYINKGKFKYVIGTELFEVTHIFKEDETILKFCNFLEAKTEEKFKQVIGHLATDVDARFSVVRNKSVPISNFLSDIIRIYMNTDCLIINSGSLRIDSIINQGELTFGILKRLIPGEYTLVRIQASGRQIWKTLENGISKFPALEGRFPIISGITFEFDSSKKQLKRILPSSIYIKGEKIDLDKNYTLTVRKYIWEGYDGFDELPNCSNIDKCDDIGTIFNIVLLFFEIIKNFITLPINELETGIFGYDFTNKALIEFIRQVVVFKNDIPFIVINSDSRINNSNIN